MALDISFLDARQLNETDISRPVRNIFRTAGVMADELGVLGDQLRVREAGTPDMTVDVLAGYGIWFAPDGKTVRVFESDATESVAITTASHAGTDTRRDIIIARHTSGTISVVAVAGVPATTGSAVPPTVPSDSLLLAEVAVVGGDTAITNAKITDRRREAQLFAANTFSGWNRCPGPLPTFTSFSGGVSTITFPGVDLRGVLGVGCKMRIIQPSGTVYFFLNATPSFSGGNTVVTMIGNTILNQAITNCAISRSDNPVSWPNNLDVLFLDLSLGSNQSVQSTRILFNTENSSSPYFGFYDTSNNLFTAPFTGIYTFGVALRVISPTNGNRYGVLYNNNGSAVKPLIQSSASGTRSQNFGSTTTIRMERNTTIRIDANFEDTKVIDSNKDLTKLTITAVVI